MTMEEGRKDDAGKARYDLIPGDALDEIAKLYGLGAHKYTTVHIFSIVEAIEWVRKTLQVENPRFVIRIDLTTPNNNVGSATQRISQSEIPLTLRDNGKRRENGIDGIRTKWLHAPSLDNLIQSRECGTPALSYAEHSQNSEPVQRKFPRSDFGNSTDARSVSETSRRSALSMSIIVTGPVGSEGCYAVDATTVSECLRKILGWYKRRFPISGLLSPISFEDLGDEKIRVRISGARNWEKGMRWGRVFGALMRHAWAWWRGEKLDPENGQHHLASVAWCALALLAYDLRGVGEDDRCHR
jgi:hypothetical protein